MEDRRRKFEEPVRRGEAALAAKGSPYAGVPRDEAIVLAIARIEAELAKRPRRA
jgi:hypothetical protein